MMSTDPGPRGSSSGAPPAFPPKKPGGDNLLASFAYALGGIAYSLLHERNFRIHCAAVVYVIYFSRYYAFDSTRYAVIALLLGFVIVCELLNTSIEKAVDMTTPVYNPLAKIAKDVAAGAVLVSALVSVVVGLLLFWDRPVIRLILEDMAQTWPLWILLITATLAWIFVPELHQKRRKRQEAANRQ